MTKTPAQKASAAKVPPAKDVDAYIAAAPQEARAVLQELRALIKAAAPMAEEVISYGMPGYKYHGNLVYFAAAKDYCGFHGADYAVLEKYEAEVTPYRAAKATLRFQYGAPLPVALVGKIVKARVQENEARDAG